MRFITSTSLGGQDISSSLMSASFSASAVEAITVRLFAAGISGSANYLAFVTLQPLGTGSAYQVIPVTSASVELGTTAIALTTIPVAMDNTDTLKVYLQGSGSDTTSPSLWTYFYGESTCTLLANNAMTAAAIASSAFTNAKFGAGAFGADTLGASALSASNISGSSLDNTVFKSGALAVGVLGASLIAASNIGGSAFDNTLFKTSAIDAPVIASSTLTNAKFASNAMGVGILGPSAIAASNIGGSAFDSTVFKSNAIPVGVLGASAIGGSNIAGSALNAAVFDSDVNAATAADIWAYSNRTLTQAAAVLISILSGSTYSIQRGDSFSLALTGLGSIANYSEIFFAVKKNHNDTDANSKILITTTSGLRYINGAAPTASENGAITINDSGSGNITITMAAVEAAKLVPDRGLWSDISIKRTTGSVQTLMNLTVNFIADVSRST